MHIGVYPFKSSALVQLCLCWWAEHCLIATLPQLPPPTPDQEQSDGNPAAATTTNTDTHSYIVHRW